MKILRNYILKEFFGLFFLSLASLLVLFLLGRGLVQMADLVFNKNVNILDILKILFYTMPSMLMFVTPMAVLISTLLCFGRLSSDNEIMAMRANGIRIKKVLAPLLIAIVTLCLASFILIDEVAPSTHYAYRIALTKIGIENPAAVLEEGVFIKKFKKFIIFIYEINRNKLKGVRIYQPLEGKPTRTIIAERGELVSVPEKDLIKLKLYNGTSDEPDPKDPTRLYKLNFRTYDLPLNISQAGASKIPDKKPKNMSVKELRNEINRLGESGIKATYQLSAEIHHKIALSFASLAFFLIGVPLGITTKRSDKSIGFGISLALVGIYWVLLMGGKAMAQKGVTDPFLALEMSNLIVGGTGAFLFFRMVKS